MAFEDFVDELIEITENDELKWERSFPHYSGTVGYWKTMYKGFVVTLMSVMDEALWLQLTFKNGHGRVLENYLFIEKEKYTYPLLDVVLQKHSDEEKLQAKVA